MSKQSLIVARSGQIIRIHPNEIRGGDVDCTNMTDAEFEAQVCRTLGIFKFCMVPA